MRVGSPLVAHAEPTVLMKPRVCSLDYPAKDAKSTSVRITTTSDHRLDGAES